MKDLPDREYFNDLHELRQSSADVSKPIADDMEEAIAPMSPPYAQSI